MLNIYAYGVRLFHARFIIYTTTPAPLAPSSTTGTLVSISMFCQEIFITVDNVPGLLKKWRHLRKKWGLCGKNDGTVI